jgi:hypothetical protein
MLRLIFRLFLLAYFVLPVVAAFLVIQTFVQIRNDVTPIYEAASSSISAVTTSLDHELRTLGSNFAPLASAINSTRNALQEVLNFGRGTIYTMIDVLNALNFACSVGHTACIPKSLNFTLPTLVNLTFIDNISNDISTISTQVNNVVSTTTAAITAYTTMLTLALGAFVAWIVLTYILFFVFLYTNLWKGATA